MTPKQPADFQRAPGDSPEPESFDEVVEIRFHNSEATSEIVSATLWACECDGSIFDDDEADVVVTAWFPEAKREQAIEALNSIDGVSAAITSRERVDWLQHYEQSLVPLLIGERFVIAPRADLVEASNRIPIILPQEQAFGTGSHESTAMCIELLESLDPAGLRCADIGTGSGILAIAMAKLGAEKIFAFDNDIETWGVLARNLERNHVSTETVTSFYASAEAVSRGAFDVVAMNILPNVIAQLVPHVTPSMNEGGALIVSGVLFTQRPDVVGKVESSGLTLESELRRGDWWAGLFRK